MQKAITTWSAANPATSALVWRLDTQGPPQLVGGFRADTPRIPASTMKLVTSAGALLEFGPAHRFSTRLLADDRTVLAGKTLVGRVYLKGGAIPFSPRARTPDATWASARRRSPPWCARCARGGSG